MTRHLIYRAGNAEDLKELKALGIISYGQYSSILTPENWEILNRFLNNEQALSALIAMSDSFVCVDNDTNAIVGMAYLIPSGNPTDIYEEGWCYIRMVGVHPDYTGQGIARKLTGMCIQKAKHMNEKIITLHTSEFMDAARHVYESLGFTILKEIPPRFGKKYWLYKLDL